jgi:hypothetical protein
MNKIILAPCDVISKIKQNSSDMDEIILTPCHAGYVQSCTGLCQMAHCSVVTFVLPFHGKSMSCYVLVNY